MLRKFLYYTFNSNINMEDGKQVEKCKQVKIK